jgi:hypothetical protein
MLMILYIGTGKRFVILNVGGLIGFKILLAAAGAFLAAHLILKMFNRGPEIEQKIQGAFFSLT